MFDEEVTTTEYIRVMNTCHHSISCHHIDSTIREIKHTNQRYAEDALVTMFSLGNGVNSKTKLNRNTIAETENIDSAISRIINKGSLSF